MRLREFSVGIERLGRFETIVMMMMMRRQRGFMVEISYLK